MTITSDAESDTNMTAEVSQNAGLKEQYSHPDTVQTALGSTVAKLTSLTTVAAGANVSGLGSVAITATGSKSDTLNVSTASYGDGKVGLTAAVSIDTSDVETHVNGTVTAGTAPAIQSLTFNSSLAVDFATSSIVFGSSPGYTTGQALIYSSGVGGAIPGLVSGQVYYAIVSSSSPNALQLAATKADAESGTFIVFGPAYPTLSAAGLNVPITSVDAPDSEIQFDYDPGFTEGQQVTFTPAAGNFLGYNDSNNNLLGALPAGTYTVHIVNGTSDSNNLYTIQLQNSSGTVALNDSPLFTTPEGKMLQVVSFDTNSNTVSFDPDALTALGVTLTNGESLTYTQALDANVSGLTDGQTYYAIVNSTTPGVIQLASTPTQAEAANPAIQDASPTLAWNNNGTAQTLSISQIEVSENTATNTPWNTLEFTSDPAIPDGTPVTYTEVPGKPIGGLTNGDTYYAYNETNPNFDSTDPIYLLVLKTTPSSSAAPVTLSQWQTLTDSSGNIYNILGSDALHDTVNIVAQDGSVPTLTTGTALTFTDSFGLSIGGLISGQTYYAIIAPSQPNSGSLLLALDNNQQDASAASPQDVASLQQTVPLGTLNQAYMSGTQQTLQPLDSAGLTITSTLTSGDTLSIGSQVGGTPTFGQMLTQANLAFSPSAWSNFVNSNWKESSAQANAVAPQGAPGWSLASAAAYLQVTNTCLVEIGSSAVLTSTGSITIGSTVTENAQPQISTSISKSTASNAASTNVAIGVGVLLAFYTTDNQAVIDSNARVDAGVLSPSMPPPPTPGPSRSSTPRRSPITVAFSATIAATTSLAA